MRVRRIAARVYISALTMALLTTALAVASALAGDIQPPVPR